MGSATYGDLLKAADDEGLSVCPPGTYDVKVYKAEAGTTSKGNKMFTLVYEIVAGPNAGRRVKNWMAMTPDYPGLLKKWFREMAAMGLPREYWESEPADGKVCADLTNRMCRIEVGVRKDRDGEDTEDIKKIMPPVGGAQPAPAASSLGASFPPPAAGVGTKVPGGAPAADVNAPSLPY